MEYGMTLDNNAHHDQAVPLTDDVSKRDGALMSIHNLAFYLDTLRKIRQHLRLGRFREFRDQALRSLLASVDSEQTLS